MVSYSEVSIHVHGASHKSRTHSSDLLDLCFGLLYYLVLRSTMALTGEEDIFRWSVENFYILYFVVYEQTLISDPSFVFCEYKEI